MLSRAQNANPRGAMLS